MSDSADSNTLTIYVKPQTDTDPKVWLSEADPNLGTRKKIRWEKAADAPDFDFICLAPDSAPHPNPFQKIKQNKNRVKCKFDLPEDGTEYAYMIVIEFEGVAYDTNDDSGAGSGRAVIRN